MEPSRKSVTSRLALVAAMALAASWVSLAATHPVRADAAGVVSEPVSFAVRNVNGSKVACASDGGNYVVAGHLVGPAASLRGPGPHAVALYLHGLGFGQWFWSFTAVPGYDFTRAEAAAGHVSVVIDRLGYGASSHPPGTAMCLGSQADMAHQVVQQLRAGTYSGADGLTPAFGKVALTGHSAGGAVAQIEAYSFHDVDALAVLSYADLGSSPTAVSTFAATGQVCLGGGQPAGPGQPAGYAYFGQTPQDFDAVMFHDADPAVVQAATPMRLRDPCGDTNSFPAAIATDIAMVPSIKVPVLLVFGQNDALFPPPAESNQRALFAGSPKVQSVMLADTGHALTLERSAPSTVAAVSGWLTGQGV
jgi:pimeloyl-ACP methyl ester carboxylesterase